MNSRWQRVLAPLAVVILAETSLPAETLPVPVKRAVDFRKDIQPLFRDHCYRCHGAERREAGLRLDLREEALNGGDQGPAFVAGKSADSLLIKMVTGVDPDVLMPPEGERLTDEQVGLLRAWIDQGAEWPREKN